MTGVTALIEGAREWAPALGIVGGIVSTIVLPALFWAWRQVKKEFATRDEVRQLIRELESQHAEAQRTRRDCASAHAVEDERINGRIALLEQRVSALPGHDDIHRITELLGRMDERMIAIQEILGGLSRQVDRHETIIADAARHGDGHD